ncbi:hypothetical protein UlMin_027131 [Ulmus minor]
MSWLSIFLLFLTSLGAFGEGLNQCEEELRCGSDGPAIRFPFRRKDQPEHCGYPGFELSCTATDETLLELPIPAKFFVRNIFYDYQSMEIYAPDNCLPRQFLKFPDLSTSPFIFQITLLNYTLFNCSGIAESFSHISMPCLSGSSYQIKLPESFNSIDSIFSLIHCTKIRNIIAPHEDYIASNTLYLSWLTPTCGLCEAKGDGCRFRDNDTTSTETTCFARKSGPSTKFIATGVILGTSTLVLIVVMGYRFYNSDKVEKASQLRLERFLEDYKAMKPSRYSFADIKKVTNQFKDKLGQGAYGTVFRGKLATDCLVAVKILNISKENGEEFVNEVGTLGLIRHVNVVRLVGFCADGFRRALVYEFLPKGSLQDYISLPDSNNFLGWEKLHDIALGIAKGIEYLHQGCEQRILHFDIKPHNILLDHNFIPKICDFGLAKLCSKDQSVVSMTTARGTLGYIAPEVFSRNFGNVSYKSDVYSFGMLLLEMIGGRKNTNLIDENNNSAEVYYPEWIYNLIQDGDDLRIHVQQGVGEANGIAQKLAIVGLWCIQWHPVDRPTMKVVVQWLEEGGELAVPPNPFGSTDSIKIIPKIPRRRMNLELESIVE